MRVALEHRARQVTDSLHDHKTFVAVPLTFGLVATIASYMPVRRATNVDSMVALRIE